MKFRFSVGSLMLATLMIAVVIACVNQFGRHGGFVALFWFYLFSPTLLVAFIEVSVDDHDDITSEPGFRFFIVMFAFAFITCGASVGTFVACLGPIFFWPPQFFAIVWIQGLLLDRERERQAAIRRDREAYNTTCNNI